MPPKNRVTIRFDIEDDQAQWLRRMAKTFDLHDESKALRVLLDFAIRDVDESLVFAEENMRCRHC